ncbi:MAG: hypothetical protein QOJ35_174 [Solirubrobacteraceae bacterium]|jgi:hypothetical protein|nr:hypothetical protein [Solirubrobacteraceae bacterium]
MAEQAEQASAEVEDEQPTAAAEEPAADEAGTEDSGMAGAVDDRAAELTGSAGAAATDAAVADNRGPVADAEAHLEDADLAADRETLKNIQQNM